MLGLVVMFMASLCVKMPCENRAAGSTTAKKTIKSSCTTLLARVIIEEGSSALLYSVRSELEAVRMH